MRHRRRQVKLNRRRSHRRWLLRNLAASLVERGQLETTLAKARFLQPKIETLVSLAKQPGLAVRRRLAAFLPQEGAAKKLREEWAPLFRDRKGGCTRLLKLGPRRGDNAPLARLEFVARPAAKEKREKKGKKEVKKT